ncbi:MAG: hypothetical protein MZV70_52180 [Desulfobacterales bacterium]|nr:hypothetical protein [Desulfobacterales bacterium]
MDGPYFDTLELYVDGWFVRSFNPTYDVNGAPLQPYPIPRRTGDHRPCLSLRASTVTLRFLV